MFLKGYKHREIGESLGFISKWTQRYEHLGVSGLKLGYSGSIGYLESEQRQSVISWLKRKNYWNLAELQGYIEQKYEVVFNSQQSYYTLFEQADISWKKTQKRNPKADPELVEKKTGDYRMVGGSSAYGAVDVYTQQCLIQASEAGNSEGTIAFLKYLLSQCPNSRIALIWDGATYHRSQAVRAFLESVNQRLDESNWKITCIRFAPNDPKQNPIEDIWLQAKRFIREYYHLCQSFNAVKFLFEFVTHRQTFDFPKLFTYRCFSQLI